MAKVRNNSSTNNAGIHLNEQNEIHKEKSHTIFKTRESLLTDLVKDKNIKPLYDVFLGIFFFTMLYSVLKDYQREGRPYFGTRLILSSFSQFDLALVIWVCMFISCISVYFVFSLWARVRNLIQYKSSWDRVFALTYLSYALGLSYFAARMTVTYNLGVASSLSVMAEMTRLLMKSYAFIRSNCPKYLESRKISVENTYPLLSHYLYFLFAPTLVYADAYPRTNRDIRWGFVTTGFAEMTLIVFFYSITFENTYLYYLQDYGIKDYSLLDILTLIVEFTFTGYILLILFFFGCHSYLNITAELSKFSDRLFYKDWWTACDIDEFFRKWSYFVHQWLYKYIYKDCCEVLFPGRQNLARVIVLVLSAYFHDLIICVSCRFFLPLISLEFLIAIPMKAFFNNKLILALLGFQVSCRFTLATMEYFARLNCPIPNATMFEHIQPRFMYC